MLPKWKRFFCQQFYFKAHLILQNHLHLVPFYRQQLPEEDYCSFRPHRQLFDSSPTELSDLRRGSDAALLEPTACGSSEDFPCDEF